MTPTLIVLSLLAIAVAIVVLATRQPVSGIGAAHLDPETGWNDPITPADSPGDNERFPQAPSSTPEDLAHVPADPRDAT
jgi:hypothetical protein